MKFILVHILVDEVIYFVHKMEEGRWPKLEFSILPERAKVFDSTNPIHCMESINLILSQGYTPLIVGNP